jgi:hypothetical protein
MQQPQMQPQMQPPPPPRQQPQQQQQQQQQQPPPPQQPQSQRAPAQMPLYGPPSGAPAGWSGLPYGPPRDAAP